ncbi:MBL fold metallo-hydrolase [Mangrovimonas sp. CR14]|uniref:MBL fold metallo-hydrolase n=1 Tax=Mangrovimonas sp. CR14 TaxID=2706120 RepID=UPI00141DB39E|nr:MBL fold metallo-hydrolase [Mangrovimonas sp. CR14]NIK93305.1 MBL fold metallo-hydrolase [Mangrovimonas sp. CR14]
MKRILKVLLGLILFLSLITMGILNQSKFGQHPKGERLERIKKSANYQDGAFKNLSDTKVMTSDKGTFRTMLDFMLSKKVDVTPTDSLPFVKTNLKNLNQEEDILVWFGHSSYFMRIDGRTYLVDPVFCGYAAPFSFMNKAYKGTNNYHVDDLPNIDYLIISHDHWDHLDYETILQLKPKVKQVVCALGVGQHLEYWGYETTMIHELDWYEGISFGDVNFTATPARHFSGRGLRRNKTLWASYVLKTPSYNFYIGGDSGYDPFYKEIGSKYGPFDLAIIEQGQYSEDWNQIHLLPKQLFQVAEDLNVQRVFPVHNSKFALSGHPWYEPLNAALENKESEIALVTPMVGEVVSLNDSTQVFSSWWKDLK